MSRHDPLIIKDTHRGLLYEDGVFREVLPAGRYQIPRPPSKLAAFFGKTAPMVEVLLIDIRGRDRTIVVQELLTADGATISANFVIQFRVEDPLAAVHQVKSFEERLYAETQTAARRVLRGLSLEEVIASRDEIGEEILLQVQESSGSYGLAVTGLDFKDLIVPQELRAVDESRGPRQAAPPGPSWPRAERSTNRKPATTKSSHARPTIRRSTPKTTPT